MHHLVQHERNKQCLRAGYKSCNRTCRLQTKQQATHRRNNRLVGLVVEVHRDCCPHRRSNMHHPLQRERSKQCLRGHGSKCNHTCRLRTKQQVTNRPHNRLVGLVVEVVVEVVVVEVVAVVVEVVVEEEEESTLQPHRSTRHHSQRSYTRPDLSSNRLLPTRSGSPCPQPNRRASSTRSPVQSTRSVCQARWCCIVDMYWLYGTCSGGHVAHFQLEGLAEQSVAPDGGGAGGGGDVGVPGVGCVDPIPAYFSALIILSKIATLF